MIALMATVPSWQLKQASEVPVGVAETVASMDGLLYIVPA